MPGLTPNRSIRYPLPGEAGLGAIQMEAMVADLDTAYTATDALRSGALGKPQATLYRPGSASSIFFLKNTPTTLSFTQTIYDNAGLADLGNNRLKAPKAGVYLLHGATSWTDSVLMTNPCAVQLGLSINGGTSLPNFIPHKQTTFSGNENYAIDVWGVAPLAVNDVVTLVGFWTAANTPTFDMFLCLLEGWMLCTNP